jgi:NAD(P)-dependent dehydrogenase (short-subunit alcohol dehydrogenase family)
MDEKFVSKSIVINLESHFWLIKEFLGAMKNKNSGHIVSMSSMAGVIG